MTYEYVCTVHSTTLITLFVIYLFEIADCWLLIHVKGNNGMNVIIGQLSKITRLDFD